MSTFSGTIGQQSPGPVGTTGREQVCSARIPWILEVVPVTDWITFALLGVMLVAVGWAVQLAEWGDLPSILPTLILGWIAAFLASRSSLHLTVKLLLAVIVGFGIIMWQGSIPADGTSLVERSRDAWDRFWAWIVVAKEGGISTDSVPFALMFMTASWVTSYTVTALTFRLRNPWAPIVLLSLGLMSNLSFRPGLYEQTFFIFIIAAIALFAHLTAARRMARWEAQGVKHPTSLGWMSMTDGLLLGIIVVGIALILPIIEPRSKTLDKAWDVVSSPIDALHGPATRLLAGVKAKPGSTGLGVPDAVLTFKGPIHLTDVPLAWVNSRYSTMLPGRVYDTYASTGWIGTAERLAPASAGTELFPEPTDLERERTQQFIQPLVGTALALPAGGVFEVDRAVVAEYLEPVTYRVPLNGPVGSLASLPDDVRDLVFDTRFAMRDAAASEPDAGDITLNSQPLMPQQTVIEYLQDHMPADLEVRLEMNEDNLVEKLALTRIGPVEQIQVTLQQPLESEQMYSVTTYVSIADDEALQESGDDYPNWVKDRYLSLPGTLPADVKLLAAEIVRSAGAVTPFEKVEAVQEFLQGQVYSQEISGPAANEDGVYYFLFRTQNEPCPSDIPDCDKSLIKGYSQYYGSAGAVLLRAVGVPARMVAGWAAGEYIPAVGSFLIRDSDRHGWTQVYFQDYGWVDVEMTAGKSQPVRGQEYPVRPSPGLGVPDLGSFEEDPNFQQDLQDLEALAQQARELALRQGQGGIAGEDSSPFKLTWVIIPIAIVGLFALAGLGWTLWFRGMSSAESTYTKMVRVGWLLGVRHRPWQTPTEYARAVGVAIPAVADSAMLLAIEFEREMYSESGREFLSDDLQQHWRKVQRGLIGYRLRHLRLPGRELDEGRSA
jgi:hypothetical protein